MALSPLYDIYDPYGTLRQQAQFGLLPQPDEEMDPLGLVPLGPRKPTLSDLMPEEEKKGWLKTLASMGASGLSGLGWILDTPGSMVRGTLSGGLGKGLSALWETTDERVDGRELARQYGLADKRDGWLNYAGGLATEIALDPLTYASFGLNAVLGKGAKTAAGKAAQAAGLLDDFDLYAKNVKGMGTRQAMREATARELLTNKFATDAARDEAMQRFLANAKGEGDLLDAPLAKMNRVTIPGVYDGAADFYGKAVGDTVAKYADELGVQAATNPLTGPAVRGLQAAFDPAVLGMTDYDRQWEARGITAARKAREKADRRTLIELQMDAENALRSQGSSLQDFSPDIRDFFENGQNDMYRPNRPQLADLPEVQKLFGYFEGYRDQAVRDAQALGIPLEEFNSRAGVGFFPRQQAPFDVQMKPQWPAGVIPNDRAAKPYTQGVRAAALTDNAGRGRREYTDVLGGTATLNEMSLDADLQAALRGADNAQAREILAKWWADRGNDEDLYSWIDAVDDDGVRVFKVPELPATHPIAIEQAKLREQIAKATLGGEEALVETLERQAAELSEQAAQFAPEVHRDSLYTELADLMRSLDPQHAQRQLPLFGQNSFNEMARYVTGRGRVETNANELLDLLKKQAQPQARDAVTGGVNYDAYETLKKLGFTAETAPEVLARRLGVPVESLADISFPKKFVDDWARVVDKGRMPPELNAITNAYDNFTKSFKTLALLWPSRYTRDAYSGAVAAATKGAFSPFDWMEGTRIRTGDYSRLPDKLRHLPDYQGLTDEQIVRKFLTDAGAEGLGTSTVADELTQGVSGAQVRELYPGMARPNWGEVRDKFANAQLVRGWNPLNSDWSPFAVRGSSGNRNPLLDLGDRLAETTDAGNRYGTYLNQIRKGKAPSEAARIADLTQVNYRDATDIERNILKRAVPFYSYSRGILPLIADQLIEQPAGLMGISTRAINRAGVGSEDSFTPEYLRQSASVPVPTGIPGISLDADSNLKRFLTNIDLPWESVINLITPGTGNTLTDKIGSGLRKTAMNLLGQTNPLVKGPLEAATNRQFYSGRQLSDLYSMLEQSLGTPGRGLEQLLVNMPGGSRLLGTIRQATDERLPIGDRLSKLALNTFTGLKFQDVDEERTKRLAARDMLNQLLETTPGVRTFENIDIPPDVLARMPEEQKRMFLLYRIIQSESAKRARDRKKQAMALDPLQVLGVVQDA